MTETHPPDLPAPPAAVRNASPIEEVLARVFAPLRKRGGLVIEIAAGSGYHASHFARAFPELTWQPTDCDTAALANIATHVAAAHLSNLRAPLTLDVRAPWPVSTADAVLCINMIHISPWEATLALFTGAGRVLPPEGLLITYGPYSIAGDFLAESNVVFDQSLKSRNSTWGIRDVNDVARFAADAGFSHDETVRMPANNLMLVFRKLD